MLSVPEIYAKNRASGLCVIGRPRWNREASAGDPDVAVGVILPRVGFGGEIFASEPVHVRAVTLIPLLAVQLT